VANHICSEPAEYVPIEDTYNPTIHRINHAVKARAVYPDKPVPPTPTILLRFSAPPNDLIEKVQSRVDALITAAEVKKGTCCVCAVTLYVC
jgi:ATP-dependent DNA helicase 2 subunit 2